MWSMRYRILRTLFAFVAAGAVAGGGAAYAAWTHHGRAVGAPRYHAARGVTGMSGATASHHCPGM
jgi:hypothetical protein